MEKKLFWRILVLGIITCFITTNIGVATTITSTEFDYTKDIEWIKNNVNQLSEGYTNLTVHEVWDLISDSTNGIQFLIDVRTPLEYFNERIYTSSLREKPRLFPVQLMQLEGLFLQFFMNRYADQEIILFCRSANRSFIAAKILIDHGFSGTIYNMLGGINEWKLNDLPTVKGWF